MNPGATVRPGFLIVLTMAGAVWPLELRYSGGTAAANRARRSVGKMEVLPRMPHDRVVIDKQHERAEVGGWRLMCRRGALCVLNPVSVTATPSGDRFDVVSPPS